MIAATIFPQAASAGGPDDLQTSQEPVQLDFARAGFSKQISLPGLYSSKTVYLPVNPGYEPASLNLELLTTPLLPEGYLTISNRGNLLTGFPLESGASSITVPLTGAQVKNDYLELTFGLSLKGSDQCAAGNLYEVRILPTSSLALSGEPEPPGDIAHFFPPSLDKVIFYVPEPVGDDAANAVLWAASYLARKYPRGSGRLIVKKLTDRELALSDEEANDPFTRLIIWTPGSGAELIDRRDSLGAELMPALALGSATEAKKLFGAQAGMKAAVFRQEETRAVKLIDPTWPGKSISLSELGYPSKKVEGMGRMTAYYDFSLSDFGPNKYPTGLRLRIVHTPVQPGSTYVELALNGATFYTLPLNEDAADFNAKIPTSYLQRNNTLEIRFFYSPPGNDCSLGAMPFSATIDPESTLQLADGAPLTGFDGLPQAFLPDLGVYLDSRSVNRLQLATELVQAMQRTSKKALTASIVSQPNSPSLLAVGGEELAAELQAPIRGPGIRIYDTAGTTWLQVDADEPYAALQAYEKGEQTVLLLSSREEGLMKQLLDKVLAGDGWYGLHGDTALLSASGQEVVFKLNGTALRVASTGNYGSWIDEYRWLLIAVLVVIIVAILAVIYPRVVRPINKQDE